MQEAGRQHPPPLSMPEDVAGPAHQVRSKSTLVLQSDGSSPPWKSFLLFLLSFWKLFEGAKPAVFSSTDDAGLMLSKSSMSYRSRTFAPVRWKQLSCATRAASGKIAQPPRFWQRPRCEDCHGVWEVLACVYNHSFHLAAYFREFHLHESDQSNRNTQTC